MIKIGLCDDNNFHINELSKILKNVAKNNDIKIELNFFSSGEMLLDFYENNFDYYDILFLDILMNGSNGIDIAKAIREIGHKPYIVFGTISKDYALDSYSVDAYQYLLKPYTYKVIESILLELNMKIKVNKKNIIYVKNNQDIYSFSLENVLYFESNLRKIIAYLSNGEKITFYKKMSDFEKELNSAMFVRCHRSFLINLIYLKNIIGSDIITTTNHTIPISKKYLLATKAKFMDYIKSKL